MRPQFASVGPLTAASANAICLSQTPSGAGALTLNGALVSGGVATLPQTRRVRFTTVADETAVHWVVTGTTFNGQPASETVTGVNNTTVDTILDYATVTGITGDAATTGAITVGTSPIAGSPWIKFDHWLWGGVAVQIVVTGTINYTLQQTLDDPGVNSITINTMTWFSSADASVVAATASKQSNYMFAPVWARILLNSGTGSCAGTFIENGSP